MIPPVEPAPPDLTEDDAPAHLRLVHDAGEARRPAAPRRELPQNLEAEESVIGSLLFQGKLIKQLAELLHAQDFHHPALGAIFAAALQLYADGKPIDIITVSEHMRATETIGKIRQQGGEAYLAELSSKIATVENVGHHARIVKEKSIARRLILHTASIRDRAYLPGEDVAALAEHGNKLLAELARASAPPAAPMFDPERFKRRIRAALLKPIPPKLAFGIRDLDEALCGGFAAGSVIALCAPPKYLKTALLVELLIKWARDGERIVYITGENTEKEIVARLSAHEQFNVTNKFHSRIKHETEPHQAEDNAKAIDWLGGSLEVVSLPDEEIAEPRGMTWLEVLARCEREQPAPLIVVDYVEEFADRLPRSIAGDTSQDKNKATMQRLKNYAVRRQARVLAVCSVGRGNYHNEEGVFQRQDAKPEDFRSVAKHSGYIEYAVGAILALQFAGDSGDEVFGDAGHKGRPMKLHLAFAREGTGPVTVPIIAYGGSCKFEEDVRPEAGEPSEAYPPGLEGEILRLLASPENADGHSAPTVASLLRKNSIRVKNTLRELVKDGRLCTCTRTGRGGTAIIFVHPKYWTGLPLGPDPGEGGMN